MTSFCRRIYDTCMWVPMDSLSSIYANIPSFKIDYFQLDRLIIYYRNILKCWLNLYDFLWIYFISCLANKSSLMCLVYFLNRHVPSRWCTKLPLTRLLQFNYIKRPLSSTLAFCFIQFSNTIYWLQIYYHNLVTSPR